MHYYKFNIADWVKDTAHLSLKEEAILLRLINYYVNTESFIPNKTQMVLRKLRIADESETVEILLEEFFIKSRDGWRNKELDKIISEYQKRSERNRKNGKSGGRPKNNDLDKPTGLPDANQVESEEEPNGNLNQELLTTNQELVTNNKEICGYAFYGEVIKLKQDDFQKWKELYGNIDLVRELKRFDLEFSNKPPKNWFMTLSAKLNYQNNNATKPSSNIGLSVNYVGDDFTPPEGWS